MGLNKRVEIYRIAVDAAGDPDIVQLPNSEVTFRKVTASIESALQSWTLYAPNIDSPSKTFSPGQEYVFQNGPFQGGDVFGYVELASGSDYLILVCER